MVVRGYQRFLLSLIKIQKKFTYICKVTQIICNARVRADIHMDQPGKVASPARGQLNRKMDISLSAFVPENLVS